MQEAEISRREKELIATVLKQAEVERKRIETLALAERQRRVTEASGIAESLRVQGEAEADVVKFKGNGQAEALRVQGLAEAEIIRAKGEAEAAAMNLKAGAFHEYNQAAILDKLMGSLPEVVRAISEPLTKVDKITIVSTGEGGGGMASHLTGDITKVAAQVPALFESLMGVKISDLMTHVPAMRSALSAPANNGNGNAVVSTNGNGNGHASNGSVAVVKNTEKPVTETNNN